jgi:NADP-dependent 3-hydroxy acid dehydrogenase YdfG
VVITGASSGIGEELGKQLGAKGAKVVLAARRKAELDAVAGAIGKDALVPRFHGTEGFRFPSGRIHAPC